MSTSMRDVLHGTKPGRIQSVGLMQVIPLILNMEEDNRFSAPDLTVSTSDYGTIHLKNSEAKPTIAPVGATYLTKQHGQDHAIMGAETIDSNSEAVINTAACVQSTQSGSIHSEKAELLILPYGLRETAIKVREKKEYSKLWSAIEKFNKTVNVSGGSHLEYFVKKYTDTMDQFVAEFEIVPDQIGAIVLIDGIVHGVERAPNVEYWKGIWKALIRMCYGSQAIAVAEGKSTGKKASSFNHVPIDSSEVEDLDDLEGALLEAEEKTQDLVAEIVRSVLDDNLEAKDSKTNQVNSEISMKRTTMESDRFVGQTMQDGECIVYASMITKQNWQENAIWREAPAFVI